MTGASILRAESAIGGEEPPFPRSRAVICTAWRLTCDIRLHGNEAWAASSTSCAERADLCGEESGWQERGASGPGPLALGQHQRCRCVPGRAGPQAPAGVVLCCAANRPAPQRWGSCPVTVLEPGTTCAPLRAVPVGGSRVHTAEGTTPAVTDVAGRRASPCPALIGRGRSLPRTMFCGPVLDSPRTESRTAARWAASPLGLS